MAALSGHRAMLIAKDAALQMSKYFGRGLTRSVCLARCLYARLGVSWLQRAIWPIRFGGVQQLCHGKGRRRLLAYRPLRHAHQRSDMKLQS